MKKLSRREIERLVIEADIASQQAYAPYSGYRVGAALLSKSGKVFHGCNVENASYSLTICAERNAVFQAVAEGEMDFRAIAVYVDSKESFPPCGACRQVLSEFTGELPVIMANRDGYALSDIQTLLPGKFSLKHE